jgi:homoserine kinase type II
LGVFTRIDENELRTELESFSLGAFRRVEGIPHGSVNSNFAIETDGGRFFLRVYEEQGHEGAKAEAELLARLDDAGLAVARPLRRSDGAIIFTLAGKPAALFRWCAGHMRCQASVTAADTAQVGAALARVHAQTPHVVVPAGRFNADQLRVRLGRIAAAADPALAAQAAPLGESLERWLAARSTAVPRGLVHGDLFRDNVLWGEDGRIRALLDFESACEGPFVFDLMVTFLSWSFGDGFDPAIARGLAQGYTAVRPLNGDEREALLAEACFASLRFTITRITDYAMRVTDGPRTVKDWKRFAQRREALEALGTPGLLALLGL